MEINEAFILWRTRICMPYIKPVTTRLVWGRCRLLISNLIYRIMYSVFLWVFSKAFCCPQWWKTFKNLFRYVKLCYYVIEALQKVFKNLNVWQFLWLVRLCGIDCSLNTLKTEHFITSIVTCSANTSSSGCFSNVGKLVLRSADHIFFATTHKSLPPPKAWIIG